MLHGITNLFHVSKVVGNVTSFMNNCLPIHRKKRWKTNLFQFAFHLFLFIDAEINLFVIEYQIKALITIEVKTGITGNKRQMFRNGMGYDNMV